MEHGPISIETAYRMVTAISGSPAEAWVRVAHNDATLIKLALDIGVREIIVPMVTTAAEAERAVSAAKYPPAGIRGGDPFEPSTSGGPECSTTLAAPTPRHVSAS
jgi:2-keto-3-deoxy-L-rhamnonate aldolase RhmA